MASVNLPTQVLPRNVSFENLMLSSGIIPYMRSRNVEFIARRMKPFTRLYSFFGGVDVNKFVVPKLLEITMESGVFQVGETVVGSFDNPTSNLPSITFRVAQQNHKYGDYNNPSDVFVPNPYNLNLIIPSTYSATSTILNIDTYSLSNQPESQFTGYVAVGMKLKGQTSKAQATISDVKLISDQVGTIIGSFFIPDADVDVNPRFEAGSKLFRLTNNPTNSQTFGTFMTSAESQYSSSGNIVNEEGEIRPIIVDSPQTSETPLPGPGNPSGNGRPPTAATAASSGGGKPSKTTINYNYSKGPVQQAAVNDLKSLMKASGQFTKDQIKSVTKDVSAKRQSNIVGKINGSSWAKSNNVKVSTSNTGTKRTSSGVRAGGVTVGAKGAGAKTSTSKGGSSGGGRSSSGRRGGRGGGGRGGGGGGRGGGGRGGGGGGRRSDFSLKKNIVNIDNALNRLMNIDFLNNDIN